MTNRNRCLSILIPVIFIAPSLARAHGYAGERFFPPTITTDDPFAADELALPTISAVKNSDGSREVDIGFELDKLILPNLSIGVSETHTLLNPHGDHRMNGWGNLEVNL